MSTVYSKTDKSMYIDWVGQIVRKRSNCPFSNGEKTDKVTGFAINPHTDNICFTFENSKIVDCFQCRLVD